MKTTGSVWMEKGHARSAVRAWTPVAIDKAFAYVSDFSRHHEWAMDEITVTAVTPGPVKLGSQFKSVGRQAGKDWPADLEVTAYEPPARFEFTATGGPLDSPPGDPHRHEFLLKAENRGTSIELRRSDPPPPNVARLLFRLFGYLLLRSTLGKRKQTLENLINRLESQDGKPPS